MKEAPLSLGGFSCFSDTPYQEGTEGGYVDGMGIGSRSAKVMSQVSRILLREYRT